MTPRLVTVLGLAILQSLSCCRGSRTAGANVTTVTPPAPKKAASITPAPSAAPAGLSLDELAARFFAPEHVLPPYTGPRVSSIVGGCAILVGGGVRCFEPTIPSEQPPPPTAGLFSGFSSGKHGEPGGCLASDSAVWCWGAVKPHVLDPQKSCHWEAWDPQPEGEDRHCPDVGGFYYCGFDQICLRPVKLARLNQVVQLEGRDQVCALRRNGEVWCWGENNSLEGPGQNRCKVPASVRDEQMYDACIDPERVLGIPPMKSITLGSMRSCSLAVDGRLFCWGDLPATYARQVVHLPLSQGSPPTEQKGWPKLKQVLLMDDFLCGLALDGQLLCQYDEAAAPSPVVGFEHMIEIAGDWLVCGRKAEGDVWCSINPWRNGPFPSPSRVPGITAAVGLFSRYDRACAVQRDGSAYCWGNWHYLGKPGSWPPMPALQ